MSMYNIKRKLETLANIPEYNATGTTEHYLKYMPWSKETSRGVKRVDTYKVHI